MPVIATRLRSAASRASAVLAPTPTACPEEMSWCAPRASATTASYSAAACGLMSSGAEAADDDRPGAVAFSSTAAALSGSEAFVAPMPVGSPPVAADRPPLLAAASAATAASRPSTPACALAVSRRSATSARMPAAAHADALYGRTYCVAATSTSRRTHASDDDDTAAAAAVTLRPSAAVAGSHAGTKVVLYATPSAPSSTASSASRSAALTLQSASVDAGAHTSSSVTNDCGANTRRAAPYSRAATMPRKMAHRYCGATARRTTWKPFAASGASAAATVPVPVPRCTAAMVAASVAFSRRAVGDSTRRYSWLVSTPIAAAAATTPASTPATSSPATRTVPMRCQS